MLSNHNNKENEMRQSIQKNMDLEIDGKDNILQCNLIINIIFINFARKKQIKLKNGN